MNYSRWTCGWGAVCLAGVGLVVFGGWFSACSGGAASRTANVLRVGNGAEVQDLDPHMVSGVAEHRVLSSLFEGLTELDPSTMQVIPGVAESWRVSEDLKTYTFVLRENARWSNGDPVTAQDFLYSWQRMLSPGLATEYAYMLHCLKNAKAFNEGGLKEFAQVGVRALDAHTLEVELEHPTPYFLSMQTHQAWYPVHRATIEQYGKMNQRDTGWTRTGRHVGNGAFQLLEWSPNEVLRVVRNPYYWNAGQVKLDGIDFYPIDNQQTEERSFRARMLDLTSTIPLHKAEVYKREHPDMVHIHPYLGVYYYRINVTRAPFTDKRVRQALSMTINREELTRNVTKGDELPAYCLTPPDTAGYTCETHVPYDVPRAKALLAEAGYPDGQGLPPVEILYNTAESHKTIAEAIQRMWKEALNVEARLLNQDWKVYLASMNSLDYAVARSAWIADVLDPVNILECMLATSGNNRTGWANAEYDRLIEAAYAASDSPVRYAALQQAEKILLDEMPVIPIYFYTWKYLQSPRVKGLTPNLLGYIRWTDISLEVKGN